MVVAEGVSELNQGRAGARKWWFVHFILCTTAIARRQAGLDIVVCGDTVDSNRSLAQAIEAAVGPYERQVPHTRTAGPLALPHFQQRGDSPAGHSFYETDHRKARTNP